MKSFLVLLLTAWSVLASCIPPPNTYDPDANGWRGTIVAQGSTGVSASTYVNVVRFAQLAKQWGIRDRIIRLNLYCGDDLTACKCPLFYDTTYGGSVDTFNNFVSGDYSESTGLTGNTTTKNVLMGTSSFINFSQSPPFDSRNDIHVGVYCRTDGTSPGYVYGVQDGSVQVANLLKYIDNNTYFRMGNLANFIQTNETSVLGFYIGVRRSDSDCSMYRNGVEVANYSPGSTAMPNISVIVHAISINGTVSAWSARTLAGYTVGHTLTLTQLTNFNYLMQWFQKTLGRNV